jgi:CBS domain-containing protein
LEVVVVDNLTVASVMTTRVVTVEPETPLRELVSTMTEFGVRVVPVVDRYDQPVGVVSRADVVPQQGRNAAELMTTPVRAVHADEPVSFVAGLLAKARIRRLFVVNWDSRLVGVVARRDLLRVYLDGDDELRSQVVGLLDAAEIAPAAVDVRVDAGVVSVRGVVARHGLADMIVRMVRTLPGVVDVRDKLSYLVDDVARPESTWQVPRQDVRVHEPGRDRHSALA